MILDHSQTILSKNQIDLILIRDTYLEIFDRDCQKEELQRKNRKPRSKLLQNVAQSAKVHTIVQRVLKLSTETQNVQEEALKWSFHGLL